MKRNQIISLFMMCLFFICLFSCSEKNPVYHQDNFQKALKKWQETKKKSNNTYSFVLYCEDQNPDIEYTADILVRDGKIIRATQSVWDKKMDGVSPAKDNGKDTFMGMKISTIDEIYDFAKAEVFKQNETENRIFFEADKNGAILKCGYLPKSEKETCIKGYQIRDFKATITDGLIYHRWKLLSIKNLKTDKMTDYTEKTYFISFDNNGEVSYSLDKNSCSGTYQLSGKGGISFSKDSFMCTQMCCDSINFNYIQVKKLEIKERKLILISENELFTFELYE